MKDDRLKRVYTELVRTRPETERADCASPDAIRDLVERSGSEADRLATLDHVMACRYCNRDFELLRSVDSAAKTRRWPLRRRPLAIAATMVLLVVASLIWRSAGTDEPTFRGGGESVMLLAPSGDVAADSPLRLLWNSVDQAVRYDVEVVDETGAPVFAATTTDTMLALPDSVRPATGVLRRWWVQATLTDSRTVRSDVFSFVRR